GGTQRVLAHAPAHGDDVDVGRMRVDEGGYEHASGALFDPTHEPSEIVRHLGRTRETRLSTEDVGVRHIEGENVHHDLAGPRRDRERAALETPQEIDLLERGDAQSPFEPKPIDAARRVSIAVLEAREPTLHALAADLACDSLITGHARDLDRRAQRVIPIPGLYEVRLAVPGQRALGILDDARLEGDHAARDLERRGWQVRARAALAITALRSSVRGVEQGDDPGDAFSLEMRGERGVLDDGRRCRLRRHNGRYAGRGARLCRGAGSGLDARTTSEEENECRRERREGELAGARHHADGGIMPRCLPGEPVDHANCGSSLSNGAPVHREPRGDWLTCSLLRASCWSDTARQRGTWRACPPA